MHARVPRLINIFGSALVGDGGPSSGGQRPLRVMCYMHDPSPTSRWQGPTTPFCFFFPFLQPRCDRHANEENVSLPAGRQGRQE